MEDHIEMLDKEVNCMKEVGLKSKTSKCELLRDSKTYLGRHVHKHGTRPDPEAVVAVLTWKAPRTDTQLMSFLGLANDYREFIKGYADKIYPMQQLRQNKARSTVGLMRLKSFLRTSNANFVRLQSSACRPRKECLF